jgi:hypothetical protein
MKPGFSSPFSAWVIEGWRRHADKIGAPAIAKRFRETLSDPQGTKARAFAKTKKKDKNNHR